MGVSSPRKLPKPSHLANRRFPPDHPSTALPRSTTSTPSSIFHLPSSIFHLPSSIGLSPPLPSAQNILPIVRISSPRATSSPFSIFHFPSAIFPIVILHPQLLASPQRNLPFSIFHPPSLPHRRIPETAERMPPAESPERAEGASMVRSRFLGPYRPTRCVPAKKNGNDRSPWRAPGHPERPLSLLSLPRSGRPLDLTDCKSMLRKLPDPTAHQRRTSRLPDRRGAGATEKKSERPRTPLKSGRFSAENREVL